MEALDKAKDKLAKETDIVYLIRTIRYLKVAVGKLLDDEARGKLK